MGFARNFEVNDAHGIHARNVFTYDKSVMMELLVIGRAQNGIRLSKVVYITSLSGNIVFGREIKYNIIKLNL